MLYYLFEWLHKLNFPGAGMFGYTSFRALMAVILALLISSIWGDKFINLLKRKQITETQRDAKTDPFGVNKVGVGQLRAHGIDPLVRKVVGREIRIGEQAVVVGRLFHAHHDGALGRRVPMPRFLEDLAALLEHFRLAADLVGQAVVEVLEAVHVLELGLHAELLCPAAAQAHVAVAAHGALFHRAVGDAQRQVDLAQLLHEQRCC